MADKNRDKANSAAARHYALHKEKILAYKRAKYADEIYPRIVRKSIPLPSGAIERKQASYARANASKRAKPAENRIRSNRYYQKHSFKIMAKVAKRRIEKFRATPFWANDFFMEEAYDLAAMRSTNKCGGVPKWHVDHIVPLKSGIVCGLHVHTNLRVIPAVENIKKGNRHWPDMPTDAVTGADHSESMREQQ